MPFLVRSSDGRVHLSWIDYLPGSHALRYSRWNGKGWTAPETVARGAGWFVNWADFPSIAAFPDGTLFAHWLVRSGAGGTYGYGIKIARRGGTGQWREVHGMNLDDKDDYAGFLSFAPDTPEAIYLSPPKPSEPGHRKTVRYLAFQQDGSVARDVEIDSDVCSCCQTSVARTDRGLIAAYRDHTPGEIRDISVIRMAGGKWTAPRAVHTDGWKINGCPTEGPSIASHGSALGIAWLTRANDRPRVQFALSKDSGESFSAPGRIDDGNPLGRPSLIPFSGGAYLAVWLEKQGDSHVDIRLRKIARNGVAEKSITVASAPAGRAAGLPKIAWAGDHVIVVWRDGRVRAEALPAKRFH